jgi:hypothetical protein
MAAGTGDTARDEILEETAAMVAGGTTETSGKLTVSTLGVAATAGDTSSAGAPAARKRFSKLRELEGTTGNNKRMRMSKLKK